MFQKGILFASFIFLLSACNNDGTQVNDEKEKEKDTEISIETENEKIVPVEKELTLPTNDEEWLSFSEESKWFDTTDFENVEFAKSVVVDFEGDSIPEVVLPYSPKEDLISEHHGYLIGKFNIKNEKWETFQNYELQLGDVLQVEAIGKLALDPTEELLITKETSIEDGSVFRIGIYRISDKEDKVIQSAILPVESHKEVLVDKLKNTLQFQHQGEKFEFKPKGNMWLVSGEYQFYLKNSSSFYDEKFIELIGDHPLRITEITFNDGYEEAKNKVGQPIMEDYLEGGLCASYGDYFFCENDSDNVGTIVAIISNDLTIHDVEKSIGKSYESGVRTDDSNYYWLYDLGDLRLVLSSDKTNPESEIIEMTIVQKPWDEKR